MRILQRTFPRSLARFVTAARFLTAAGVLTLAPAGCAAPAAQSTCSMAAEHVSVCLGAALPESALAETCDAEEANALLSSSCTEIEAKLSDRKSDLFDGRLAALGCRLGIFHLCEEAVCDADLDEPSDPVGEPIPEDGSACAQDALRYEGCGACAYYACREATAGCGEDGYLVSYALKYCNRYRLVTEPRVSPAANAWLRRVRRCLITTLDAADTGDECAAIEDAGFASHPTCYTQTGFCELPVRDWAAILATIDPADVRLREIFVTAHDCLGEWLDE